MRRRVRTEGSDRFYRAISAHYESRMARRIGSRLPSADTKGLLHCSRCTASIPEASGQLRSMCVCPCMCVYFSRSAGLSPPRSLETVTPFPHLFPGCVRVRRRGGHLLRVMHGGPASRPIWRSPASASVWPHRPLSSRSRSTQINTRQTAEQTGLSVPTTAH